MLLFLKSSYSPASPHPLSKFEFGIAEAVALADRVILIEHGQIVLNVPVDLLRPRQRGSAAFTRIVETILQRIMLKEEAQAKALAIAQEYSTRNL